MPLCKRKFNANSTAMPVSILCAAACRCVNFKALKTELASCNTLANRVLDKAAPGGLTS